MQMGIGEAALPTPPTAPRGSPIVPMLDASPVGARPQAGACEKTKPMPMKT